MNKPFTITPDLITRLLETVDKGLSKGLGAPVPGRMCVEAAVCYSMGLPHSDEPTCVAPAIRSFKITLNDGYWVSNRQRAAGMRKLAVLQLGTKDNFDSNQFVSRLIIETVRQILPLALDVVGLFNEAKKCKTVNTLEEARTVTKACELAVIVSPNYRQIVAARACAALRWAVIDRLRGMSGAAGEVGWAAQHVAQIVGVGALKATAKIAEDILIDMKVPAVEFLDMIKE
jgi:hypothetical protein